MKSRLLVLGLGMVLSTPALAIEDPQCKVRNLAGEWLTSFEYKSGGVEHDVACRIGVSRTGSFSQAYCLKDATGAKVLGSGAFAVTPDCNFTGEITLGTDTLKLNGEVAWGSRLMVGLVVNPMDNAFDSLTIVRSDPARSGRPPKPGNPIDDGDDDDTESVKLACKTEDGETSLEVHYEAESDRGRPKYQFEAEFETAAGGDFVAGDSMELSIGGKGLALARLVGGGDDLKVKYKFNSRVGRPIVLPEMKAGTVVGVGVSGDGDAVTCSLAAE